MKFTYWVMLLALTLVAPNLVHAQVTINTDTTYIGGTLEVHYFDPLLTVSHSSNNPLLTLTSGAQTSGIGRIIIGDKNGEKGRLLVDDGSTIDSSAFSYLGYKNGSVGSATVTGLGSLWSNSYLSVGHGGIGTLTIQNNGIVKSSSSVLGGSSVSNGKVIVTGTGSTWESGHLTVGQSGPGDLTIEKGGLSTSSGATLADQGSGSITVTGPGSKWQNTGHEFVIGYASSGVGTLTIENGGIVASGYSTQLGLYGTGTVKVTGAGSQWQNSNALTIGTFGTGNLMIENGGIVTSGYAKLGEYNKSTGTVAVQGASSLWQNTNDLWISYSAGNGKLTVADGGEVTVGGTLFTAMKDLSGNGKISTNGAILDGNVEFNNGLQQVQTFGNGGQLIIGTGDFGVGNNTSGTFSVSNGAQLQSENGYLGYNHDSSGTATVTGAGSQWHNANGLSVGRSGHGELMIKDGGLVTSRYGRLGESFYSSGKVTVTDPGSKWQCEGLALGVGSFGTIGILTIENGGSVTSAEATVGYERDASGTILVTGSGSQWLNDGDLTVGYDFDSAGSLTIEDGALATSRNVRLSFYGGSTANAIVRGDGSRWQISENINVGGLQDSNGTLIVEDNGVVEVGGLLTVGTPGTLSGNGGTINGNVINHGLIAPGSSPGVLTIDGDLTTDGVVAFELAGIDSGLFDQLIVSGKVHLGGVIEIDLLDGFHPTAGNSFKLLDFGTFIDSGYTFDFTHAALRKGLLWDVSTFAADGTISVAVPEVGSLTLLGIAMATGFIGWRMRIGR